MSKPMAILSWNIRHLRKEKVKEFSSHIKKILEMADVIFLYEAHDKTVAASLAEEMNLLTPNEWKADAILTVDEYVIIIWRKNFTVQPNKVVSEKYRDLLGAERTPAVVDVRSLAMLKPLTIAAWHAYGPAKVTAKDLFHSIMQMDASDVLIGDFNFQCFANPILGGLRSALADRMTDDEDNPYQKPSELTHQATTDLRKSKRIEAKLVMIEMSLSNYQGSTTYTEAGPGKRTTPLDRCCIRKTLLQQATLEALTPKDPASTFKLTDHIPLFLTIKM